MWFGLRVGSQLQGEEPRAAPSKDYDHLTRRHQLGSTQVTTFGCHSSPMHPPTFSMNHQSAPKFQPLFHPPNTGTIVVWDPSFHETTRTDFMEYKTLKMQISQIQIFIFFYKYTKPSAGRNNTPWEQVENQRVNLWKLLFYIFLQIRWQASRRQWRTGRRRGRRRRRWGIYGI